MPTKIQYTNRTVGDILTDIRADSPTHRDKGTNFEELFLKAAPLIPELEIKNVWRLADWPGLTQHGLSAKDTGIDLVAELTDGNEVAIQCKCYAEEHKVGKSDIQSFIAGAKPEIFPLRWFIAINEYTDNAVGLIKEHSIRIVDFREYLALKFDETKKSPREPWALQQEAIDDVIEGFDKLAHDRGRLIMACGTGKTFTALRIAERLVPDSAKILFIAPSIALVAQARREWLQHTCRPLACTVICSDQTTGRNASEDIGTTEISCEVTTDPEKIAAALKTPLPQGVARAVFCTYQSLKKLRDAQHKHGAPGFHLALIDEAHRTTGYLDEDRAGLFQLIHKADEISAVKRLYMTATPRIYDISKSKKDDHAHIVDMNDIEAYGPEFHRLTFKKAIEADMLCDYRVIALGITEDSMSVGLKEKLLDLNEDKAVGKAADEQAFLALGAIALAINGIVEGENTPGVLARTIAYASNIRRSKWLVRALDAAQMKSWITRAGKKQSGTANRAVTIHAEHLDGTSSALRRNAALRDLNYDAKRGKPRLITNAQLFTEGVDVPALNAIAFLDPRQSKVDTIQAVGRVMRRDQGKTLGYIIVPVILPPGADLLETLTADQSRFKSLGNVLRALQSHDERLYTELTERLTFATMNREYKHDPNRPPSEDYDPVQQSLLDEDAKQAIFAQIAKNTGIAQRGKIIADAITQSIERAARLFLQEGATQVIADTIGTPSDNEEESCKTAALLIANACIMHKRLEETGNLGGLTRIEYANLTENPASTLAGAWFTILEKDYAPVFQDATALLRKLSQIDSISSAIRTLIQCAIDNATTLNELGFDHAGPLYHKVLGTAQSDGAFYTKNLSGYLLAGLAFDEDFTDWKNPEVVNNLSIIDPACGTGTLLMAALNIIKKRAAAAQNLDEAGVNKLHKCLVEIGIYGFDINKYSVQLAACNLTIGAPDTDYERINLHTLEHGPVEGTDGDNGNNVRHGALEILLDTENKTNFGEIAMPPPPLFGEDISRKEMTEVVMPKKFDAVIYNPPFTDTSKSSGKFSKQTKSAMVKRLLSIKNTLEKRDPAAANALAKMSIQPYFTPLANSLLSKDKGKLAKIIPATVCTAENARTQRQYLANNFHIEMVVTSHDPKHINFSENTSIHECLVIGKRSADNDKPTRFVQLVTYPNNVKDAEALIDAIHGGEIGELYTETLWPCDKVRAGDWTPVQWCNPKLADAATKLNLLPNCILGEKYQWRPDGRSTRGNFTYERSDSGDVFCTIDEDIMQTISATPESKATPRPNKERAATRLWQQADHVLVACRFSTTSSRLTAIYSEKPAIGSAFRPIGVKDKETAKAYAAFLNSSFGVIQMLNRRTKKLTYPAYEAEHMTTLMLPDPNKADLTPLLDAFEQVKDTPLERLRKCAEDPARKILDHAAAKSIGIDPETTDQWRKWLSQEPTITNKPYHP